VTTYDPMTYFRQRLVHLHGVQASGPDAFLPLLLLVLLQRLLDADLGPAAHPSLEGLQLVVEGLLVLLVGCLWERAFLCYPSNAHDVLVSPTLLGFPSL